MAGELASERIELKEITVLCFGCRRFALRFSRTCGQNLHLFVVNVLLRMPSYHHGEIMWNLAISYEPAGGKGSEHVTMIP